MQKVQSSFIMAIGYDRDRKAIQVKIGKEVYSYPGSLKKYNAFLKAKSKGKFFTSKVKLKKERS